MPTECRRTCSTNPANILLKINIGVIITIKSPHQTSVRTPLSFYFFLYGLFAVFCMYVAVLITEVERGKSHLITAISHFLSFNLTTAINVSVVIGHDVSVLAS